MRVIAGEFRSRVLKSLPGTDVRPTSDKMRQTLFNILSDTVEGMVFVDAYAGTGAVGIEAISRGARQVIFIEKDRQTAGLIKSNLAMLKAETRARVIHGPAGIYLGGMGADIVFIDPPYPLTAEYEAAMDAVSRRKIPLVIVQHSSRYELKEEYGPLHRTRIVKQGENSLTFFRLSAAEEEQAVAAVESQHPVEDPDPEQEQSVPHPRDSYPEQGHKQIPIRDTTCDPDKP